MRLPLLLGFVFLGCAHHDASVRAANYEYGKDNRPYTGIPEYLRSEQQRTAPPPCAGCVPGATEPSDQGPPPIDPQ